MENNGYSADTAFEWPDKQSRVDGNTAVRDNGFPALGVDWWRVRLMGGKRYRIQMRRPSFGPESGSYRYLSLYDSLVNAQGNNYWSRSYRYGDDGSYFPLIEITPSTEGAADWWIKVDDGNNGSNGYRGAYILEILPLPVFSGEPVKLSLAMPPRSIRTPQPGAHLSATPDPGGEVAVALHESPVDATWRALCWSPELRMFAAVASAGDGGRVMTSGDGRAWTKRNTPAANAWRFVCWSAELGLFAAVAESGYGNRVMTSRDGVDWTLRPSAADSYWASVCWARGLGRFVAVAHSGALRVMTSGDGLAWTGHAAPEGAWTSVCWAETLGLFVAVGYDGTSRVMTSPDGMHWMPHRVPALNAWRSVCWSPELRRFVAVASTGTGNRIMASDDGVTWHAASAGTDAAWQCITWSPERGLFLCLGGAYAARSEDGYNWTVGSTPANQTWEAVCWSPEAAAFVGVASTGASGRVMTYAITPRIATADHAILRERESEVSVTTGHRMETGRKNATTAFRMAVLRQSERAAQASARCGQRTVRSMASLFADAPSGFDALQNPKSPDVLAAWSMQPESGAFRDLSRHGLAFFTVGAIGAAEGLNGDAALFEGAQSSSASNYLTGRNPFYDAANPGGTMSFWLRPANNNTRVVFSVGQPGTYGDRWDFVLQNASYAYWRWFYSSGNVYSVSGSSVTLNAWTHYALRWSDSTWEVFRNGTRTGTRTDAGVDFRTGAVLRMGARFDWGNNGFYPYNGRLDEVYAWNRALSDTEIKTLYAGGAGLFMDSRAGAEPRGGYHGIQETNRAMLHDTPRRIIETIDAQAAYAAAWRVYDGVYTLQAASMHRLLYPKRHHLFARNTSSGEVLDLGVAEESNERPGEFALRNVAVPDGVYEVEARSTEALWQDAVSRRVTTVRFAAGQAPTPELPAVIDLITRLETYGSEVWRVLEWSTALDNDTTGQAYAFGLWFSADGPPALDRTPDVAITRRSVGNRYDHFWRQAEPLHAAVAVFTPEGGRGEAGRIFLDWDSAVPAAPARQWAAEKTIPAPLR